VQVIARHLTEPLVPPRQRHMLVSPYVDAIIIKMMQKDRAQRYQTPKELIADLEKFLSGGVPSAYAPPQPPRPVPRLSPRLRRARLARRLRRR
jgi:serine/threonine-protein kinase